MPVTVTTVCSEYRARASTLRHAQARHAQARALPSDGAAKNKQAACSHELGKSLER